MITPAQAHAAAAERADQLIDFTQRIVATPSLSGAEGDVAALIVDEMKQLDFDEVWTDEVGNLIGKISGAGGPAIMLNGHMDVVDPGPADGWPQPAYSGHIVDGELWGRGSVDMKGPVAAMIYGAAQFKQLQLQPAGDVYMTVAVMEEIGGLGSQFLATHLSAAAAIVGEPSRNEIRLGHRGRIEIQIKFHGKSAHASVPDLAINPHFAASQFLQRFNEIELDEDTVLGRSSVAPTLYATDQSSSNVIPSEVTVVLDWRNVPSESPEVAVQKVESLLQQLDFPDETKPTVWVTQEPLTTYTGAVKNFSSVFPPFATSPESRLAVAARAAVDGAFAEQRAVDIWRFATDGGHLVAAGIPCVGFGPGDDRLAHTNQERIAVTDLQAAAATYAPLAVALAHACE